MRRLRFKKIDAFARGRARGNPAGVVHLAPDETLSTDEMLRVAGELAGFVSEVAFVTPVAGEDRRFRLRYYSAVREVAFCGHATIAATYEMIAGAERLRAAEGIQIETRDATLDVENRLGAEDAVYIAAPSATRSAPAVDRGALAAALGADEEGLATDWPVALVDAGLATLIVPVTSVTACLAATPELDALDAFCRDHQADIVALFTAEVTDPAHAFRTRVFAPTFGYLEDPATGSASAALGSYWRDEGRWSGEPIVLEQGTSAAHPNEIRLKAGGRRDEPVSFGGAAVARIEGHYLLVE